MALRYVCALTSKHTCDHVHFWILNWFCVFKGRLHRLVSLPLAVMIMSLFLNRLALLIILIVLKQIYIIKQYNNQPRLLCKGRRGLSSAKIFTENIDLYKLNQQWIVTCSYWIAMLQTLKLQSVYQIRSAVLTKPCRRAYIISDISWLINQKWNLSFQSRECFTLRVGCHERHHNVVNMSGKLGIFF